MFHQSRPSLRTVVISPDAAARSAVLKELEKDPRLQIIAEHTSLEDAYAPTEAHPPDLVICHKSLSKQPEFHMFEAMLRAVKCALVTAQSDTRAAAIAQQLGLPAVVATPPISPRTHIPQRLIAIGASTGGIEALAYLLSTFPLDCPPTVIVQHIRPEYLGAVVGRLDRACPAQVVVATPGLKLRTGTIALAPGLPMHLEVRGHALQCETTDNPPVSGHRPSVDVLFQSVALLKDRAVGVLLTGMGRDGASGLAMMRQAGAWTIAQDEATSTVHGMPRVAAQEGAVCEVLPLQKIGKAVLAAAIAPDAIRR